MQINVHSEIGSRCIVAEDGQKLHDKVFEALKAGDSVFLDFTDVRQFASPFFNYSVGQLMNEFSEECLRKLLHLVNLNEVGDIVVKQVIANAAKFKGNDDYTKIVDDILARHAGGNGDGN
ncbi:STAS-like domain-containing protein [Paraburkholderia sacchari]|uniref:STAS-like domain-containing protein n=1 Tax=Paraburkholderia sacchari TaxID=159450 RepID=UPI001BCEBF49|nr:STAS-like domain-containing protein [Paraburkholderia sacchari]